MKRYKIIISLAAIICGLMIACDNTDYSNKAPFDNMVYIKEASNSNSERVTFRNTLNEQKRAFSAKLTYPGRKRHRSEAESGSRTDKRIQCPARD